MYFPANIGVAGAARRNRTSASGAGCVKTSIELESGRIESGFLMKRFVEGEDRRLWGLRAWARAVRPTIPPRLRLRQPNRFEPEA